jgi:hypothetical protein
MISAKKKLQNDRWRRRNLEHVAAYMRRYRAANRERARAHNKVHYAIKVGRLRRPARCERCGRPSKKIDAHHEDYARPLDVKMVCPTCHSAERKA